ncbi:MAG: tetratricopeptide repeat protein [Methyloligellaceae bacterium]
MSATRTFSGAVAGLLMALALASPTPAFAMDKVRFSSATEAYRQGLEAYHAGLYDLAVPALEYAARYGVLGAQLRLAKIYSTGEGVAQSDAKAFHYYQLIADQYADTSPHHPIARYVAEAFIALAASYSKGISELRVRPDLTRATGLLRHAASYFGDPRAQFKLAQMYLAGEGVPKNPRLAVNWLANASKKQHAPSQAVLGDLLWRGGKDVRRRPLKGLALLSLARQNAEGTADQDWIETLQKRALAEAGAKQRESATEILSRWRRRPDSVSVKTEKPAQSPEHTGSTGPARTDGASTGEGSGASKAGSAAAANLR